VSLGLAALTACEKPGPSAHFTLGSSSKSLESASGCFGHDEQLGVQAARNCLEDTDDVRSFTTHDGDTFRIGVDTAVAEKGWLLFVNGNPRAIEPNTGTFRSYSTEELYSVSEGGGLPGQAENAYTDVVQLSVVQVSEDYDVDELLKAYEAAQQMGELAGFDEALFGQFEGIWNVQLEKKDH
jgi:hypothetical protein